MSTIGNHHQIARSSGATTDPMAATRMTCPEGKLGPDDGTSLPRRMAPVWLVPGRWRMAR